MSSRCTARTASTRPAAARRPARRLHHRRPRSGRCSARSSPASLDAEWERLGRPDPFTVVDAGAGPGTLARSVARGRARVRRCDALRRRRGVGERSAPGTPTASSRAPTLPDGPFDGVDARQRAARQPAVPARRVRRRRGARRSWSTLPDGRSVEVLGRAVRSAARGAAAGGRARGPGTAAGRRRRVGRRCPCSPRSRHAWSRSTTRGDAPPSWPMRPWREWLRTYRGHERGGHYLADPGAQDITAEVAVDQLPEPGRRAHPGPVPPPARHRRARRRRQAVLGCARGGAPISRAMRDAQPGQRGGGAARSDRPRWLHGARVASLTVSRRTGPHRAHAGSPPRTRHRT